MLAIAYVRHILCFAVMKYPDEITIEGRDVLLCGRSRNMYVRVLNCA